MSGRLGKIVLDFLEIYDLFVFLPSFSKFFGKNHTQILENSKMGQILRKFAFYAIFPNNKLFEEVPHLFGSEPTLRGYKFYKIYRLQGQDFNKTSIFNPLTTKKHCFDKISLSTCPQGSFYFCNFQINGLRVGLHKQNLSCTCTGTIFTLGQRHYRFPQGICYHFMLITSCRINKNFKNFQGFYSI